MKYGFGVIRQKVKINYSFLIDWKDQNQNQDQKVLG